MVRARSQGITRVTSVSQVDGDSEIHAGGRRGRFNKETMVSACTFVWAKAALPVIALKPDNSVFPHLSLVSSSCYSSAAVQSEFINEYVLSSTP